MRQDAYAETHRDQAEHVSRVTAYLLYHPRPEPGIRTQTEELIVEFRPGFARAEHKILAAQIAQFQGRPPGKWMMLGQHNLERHTPDDLVFESVQRGRQVQEGQVEPARAQCFQLLGGQPVEVVKLHLGVDSLEGRDDGCEVAQVETAGKAQHEAAGHRAGRGAGFVGGLGGQGQDRTRPLVEDPARPRKLHPGAAPVEQRHLQFLFEVLHLTAQRGLGHPQARRRVGKVQFLSHCDEVTEVSQFHVSTIPAAHGWTKQQSIGRNPPQAA